MNLLIERLAVAYYALTKKEYYFAGVDNPGKVDRGTVSYYNTWDTPTHHPFLSAVGEDTVNIIKEKLGGCPDEGPRTSVEPMNRHEITSRLPYVTDPRAQKLWEFLEKYMIVDKENFNNDTLTIPAYRVLDALSMINQDKIEYSEG